MNTSALLKGFFLFFFLDKKEPKNQGCGKIAKNGLARLNPPNSPLRGSNSGGFYGSFSHFFNALFPRPVLLVFNRNLFMQEISDWTHFR
jgi:hypothetical protein